MCHISPSFTLCLTLHPLSAKLLLIPGLGSGSFSDLVLSLSRGTFYNDRLQLYHDCCFLHLTESSCGMRTMSCSVLHLQSLACWLVPTLARLRPKVTWHGHAEHVPERGRGYSLLCALHAELCVQGGALCWPKGGTVFQYAFTPTC